MTGVSNTRNVEMVRTIGADRVIDYTQWDSTRTGWRYDLILDNVEDHALSELRRALEPKGTLILTSGLGGLDRSGRSDCESSHSVAIRDPVVADVRHERE